MLEPTAGGMDSAHACRAGLVGRMGALAFVASAALLLMGCGDQAGPMDADPDAERAARLVRGEILSFSCRPCHGLAPGDESPVGPHLHGLFGRPAAQVEAFEYSPALRASGIVWTPEALDAWLAQPESFLPGNDMDFAGFRSADDRRALIEYLRIRTGDVDVAPEAAQASEGASN